MEKKRLLELAGMVTEAESTSGKFDITVIDKSDSAKSRMVHTDGVSAAEAMARAISSDKITEKLLAAVEKNMKKGIAFYAVDGSTVGHEGLIFLMKKRT